MSPREADPLQLSEDEAVAAYFDAIPAPAPRSAPLIGFVLAAFSGALVGGLAVWWLL